MPTTNESKKKIAFQALLCLASLVLLISGMIWFALDQTEGGKPFDSFGFVLFWFRELFIVAFALVATLVMAMYKVAQLLGFRNGGSKNVP